MSASLTPLRVFISSPGDLHVERAVVKIVLEELNRSPRYRDRYKLIPYAYEDGTPALAGAEPQVVVDNYLLRPDDADILICMLWMRMGTPTPGLIDPQTGQSFQSGTEYEFLTAYRAHEERDTPLILLYRCKQLIDPDRLDTAQYERVKHFFARFAPGGALQALIGEFRDHAGLRDRLRNDLELLLETLPARPSEADVGATSGSVYFVPSSLPSGYVERASALEALRQTLLGSRATVGVVAAAALHGQGGLGKTVLARAICDDPAIRGAFPDGILWATLGQLAEPARHQRDWIRALGGDVAAASSLESGLVELKRLLAGRAMLLALDDVWSAGDAGWLQAGGPRCTALITTRDARQAEGAALVPLELMRRQESRALLKALAGHKLVDDTLADAIAERLDDLPLALKLVGAQLARGIAWADIAAALDEGDLQFLDYGQGSVLAAIVTSVSALPQEQAARYHELVVFPHDEPLVAAAVARLWAATAGLKARQTRKLLAELRDRALVQADDTLHDLQYDCLRAVVPDDERQRLHCALADAYGGSAAWPALPEDDARYAWRRLAYHLAGAGHISDLRSLLTNGAYLQGKIAALGTAALLADFALAEGDETLGRLAGALRLGAHILDRAPRELRNQLHGRLGSLPELHDWRDDGRPWFRLETQTLTPPGGPLLRTLEGHMSGVNGCALSADGWLGLSASDDGTLRVWNVASGRCERVLTGHTGWVWGCGLSADGRLGLSAADDYTLRVWDVASGVCEGMLIGHTGKVNDCAVSADGRLVLSAAADGTLRVWNVASGSCERVLKDHRNCVWGCALSADGRLGLSAAADGTLRVWDVASGSCERVLAGHTARVMGCALSADGRLGLSASSDGTLRVWNVTSGACERVLKGHKGEVRSCALSADGRLGLSAATDRTLRVWNVTNGVCERVLEGHMDWVRGCGLSADGRLGLSAAADCTLRVWDVARGQSIQGPKEHTGEVRSCALSADGRLGLSAGQDGTLRVWDVASGVCTRVLEGHTGAVQSCALSADGLGLSAAANGTLRVWDVASGACERILRGHIDWVRGCGLSADGRLGLSASDDRTLRVWDVASGVCTRVLKGHTEGARGCGLSADGRLGLSASSDGTLRVWDVASGCSLRVLAGHTGGVLGCALSLDGRLGLSASDDRTLRVWDVASGRCERVLAGHTARVWGCALSADGRLGLSAADDGTLRVWDVATGVELARWYADAPLLCCAFHPGGRRVIAGDSFGNLHWLRIENM